MAREEARAGSSECDKIFEPPFKELMSSGSRSEKALALFLKNDLENLRVRNIATQDKVTGSTH